MKLYIDTSNKDKVILKVDGDKYQTDAKKDKSQKLLPFIIEVLEKKGKKIEDISEIEVNTGPGSFTGLRVGVSVAQTIGWFLRVPVNGIDVTKGKPINIKYK